MVDEEATNQLQTEAWPSRIKWEFKEVLKSKETSKTLIKVDLADETFTGLRGKVEGPPDTAYEGARHRPEIKIPETYPFNPP